MIEYLRLVKDQRAQRVLADFVAAHPHRHRHRLLERIHSKAEDADLKSYASKIIGTVETHQQLANDTRKNLTPTREG